MEIPVIAHFPKEIRELEFDAVERAARPLLSNTRAARARVLALRLYERAIRANIPVEELLFYVFAIEVIVSAHAADHGPIPAARNVRNVSNP